MIVSAFEQLSYGTAVVLLVIQHRTRASDLVFGGVDLLLGILFMIAFFNTPRRLA